MSVCLDQRYGPTSLVQFNKETFEDTLVCVGLRRIVTVAFFAPCTNILSYLLTYN